MTQAEFLAAVEKTPREWVVRSDGKIRNNKNLCPLHVVAGIDRFDSSIAQEMLGLDNNDSVQIMGAADRWPPYRVDAGGELRRALLRACGLTESEG